jgi:hypothetical protein
VNPMSTVASHGTALRCQKDSVSLAENAVGMCDVNLQSRLFWLVLCVTRGVHNPRCELVITTQGIDSQGHAAQSSYKGSNTVPPSDTSK